MDGCMHARMDEWINGWMGGQTDGLMDGWMDGALKERNRRMGGVVMRGRHHNHN